MKRLMMMAALLAASPSLPHRVSTTNRENARSRIARVTAQPSTTARDSISVRIDSLLSATIAADGPGCAALASHDGRVVYGRGFGLADLATRAAIDTATVFQAGSLGKQLVAFTTLLLAREGRLSLDDTVRRFLSDFPSYPWPVTIRQLLTHTAGLRDEWDLLQLAGWRTGDWIAEDDGWQLVKRQRALNFRPGSAHLYSNSGYDVLARIIQSVTGEPLDSAVRARVFRPLGMSRSEFREDHNEVVTGGASGYLPRYEGGWAVIYPNNDVVGPTNFYTSAADLGRWLANMLQVTVSDTTVMATMTRRAILTSGDSADYGMGVEVGRYRGSRYIGHGGAERGFLGEVFVLPDYNYVSVVLCNRWNVNPRSLVRRMADIHLRAVLPSSAPSPPLTSSPSAITADTLHRPPERRLAGVYREIDGLRIRPITERDAGLVWAATNARLVRRGTGRYALEGQPVELEFRRAGDGSTRMRLFVNGGSSGEFLQMAPPDARNAPRTYGGSYRSKDLDVEYDIQGNDSTIVVRGPHHLAMTGRLAYRDGFVLDPIGAIMEFSRRPGGTLRGFSVSTERSRSIWFDARP